MVCIFCCLAGVRACSSLPSGTTGRRLHLFCSFRAFDASVCALVDVVLLAVAVGCIFLRVFEWSCLAGVRACSSLSSGPSCRRLHLFYISAVFSHSTLLSEPWWMPSSRALRRRLNHGPSRDEQVDVLHLTI